MPQPVSLLIQIVLLLLLPREAVAENLSLGLKLLDSSHQYRVEDPSRALVAELIFPSKSLVGSVAYTHKTPNGRLAYTFEHSLKAETLTGTDTDWYQGDVSVFSKSSTELEQYFSLSIAYNQILTEHISIEASLFHKYWKLNWSDTKQYDYIDDVYSELSSTSVRFTQTVDGLYLGMNYEEKILNLPISISLAGQLAKHDSVDEHLARNFYTVSQDWLYGYLVDISVEVLNNEYGVFDISAGYEVLSGDSNMDFYSSSDVNYMSLPASFETIQKSMKINYNFAL